MTHLPKTVLDATFGAFFDHTDALVDFMDLVERSIGAVPSHMRLVHTLAEANPRGLPREVVEEQVEWTEKMTVAAEREIDRGFPLLYGLVTVALWGSFETFVTDFLISWIGSTEGVLQHERVSKLRFAIGDFYSAAPQDQAQLILDRLTQELKAEERPGVARFEALLAVLGLGGEIRDDLRRNLIELVNVRHVIVHRRSRADDQVIERCPWLPLAVGDPIVIGRENVMRYFQAANDYAGILLARIRRYSDAQSD